MLRVIENKKMCEKKCVDGMYFPGLQEIIVADKLNKGVLVHEISHYLWDIGSTKYLDSILDICNLLDVDFWDIVDVDSISTISDDYTIFMDELCAYFMESIFEEYPTVVLYSHPVYRIWCE